MGGFAMNSVIITGATSMLGLALIGECIKNNTCVTAVIREYSAKRDMLPNSDLLTVRECDASKLSDFELDTKHSLNTFYHFAWEATANSERNIVDVQNRNIMHTLSAVHLAHRLGCGRFIGAGSQAEYGRISGIISPTMRVAPDSAYGIAKFAAGRLASLTCEQLGMEFIWPRIFSTYGAYDKPSTMVMYCIESLLKGEKPILTKCEQVWDYLHCEDAARALYLIGKKGINQSIYHVGSGQARPLTEYVYAIRDAIDPLLPLGIGEKAYAPKQVMYLCPDISDLTRDTGFEPSISFKVGIRKTLEWYRERVQL